MARSVSSSGSKSRSASGSSVNQKSADSAKPSAKAKSGSGKPATKRTPRRVSGKSAKRGKSAAPARAGRSSASAASRKQRDPQKSSHLRKLSNREQVESFVDPRRLPASESVQESLEQEERSGTGVFAEDPKVLDVKERLEEKAHARRTRLLHRALVVLGVILAAVAVMWVLFFSPLCRVSSDDVKVEGANRWVSSQRVAEVASSEIDKSLLLVSSGNLSKAVSAVPGVESVTISKSFPNTLTLRVTPRVPRAIIKDNSGTLSVVDKDAVVIATVHQQFSGVPLIQVDDADKELASRAVKQALSVLASVPTSLLSKLTKVTAMTQDSVTTQTKDGHTIIWGNASQMKLKSVVVQDILSSPKVLGAKTSIDVSAPQRPILK